MAKAKNDKITSLVTVEVLIRIEAPLVLWHHHLLLPLHLLVIHQLVLLLLLLMKQQTLLPLLLYQELVGILSRRGHDGVVVQLGIRNYLA